MRFNSIKKVIVTTAILSFIVCIPTHAEESRILFRGIEWGSSYEEATSSLPENIVMRDIIEGSSYGLMDTVAIPRISTDYDEFLPELTCISDADSLGEEKVAGYDLMNIQLLFAYVPEDGLLLKDDEHTALCYAEYVIDARELPESAYDDLLNKLSFLYGVGGYTTEFQGVTEGKSKIWMGADGAFVELVYEHDLESENKFIFIRYSFDGASDIYLRNAYEALLREKDTSS